ncbi:hypothetical protein SEPCBS119000_000112 [Sporothrix epigloea]|uniref:Phosphoribosylaminoimidazole-succinocarboxamide synthase n=1 Tax=Sporothrix epigloea TaxID=1892477 RepID=A0ABP0D626_9PEZI
MFASTEPASPRSRPPPTASGSDPSVDEIYGPDRLFPPPLHHSSTAYGSRAARPTGRALAQPPHLSRMPTAGGTAFGAPFGADTAPPTTMGMTGAIPGTALPALGNPGQCFKDALAREASNVTPGIDDTPYILYALGALSGDVPLTTSSQNDDSGGGGKHASFPFRYNPDEVLGYYRPPSMPVGGKNIGTASIKSLAPSSPAQHELDRRFSGRRSTSRPRTRQPSFTQPRPSTDPVMPRVSNASSISTLVHPEPQHHPRSSLPADRLKDSWAYLDLKSFSPQTQLVFPTPDFKPLIMRPASLILLIALCALMIAALVFSAVYSSRHHGLIGYDGSLYGSHYFIFRVLPQLLSVLILLYALHLSTTMTRILPFSRMQALENPHPERRHGAIFDDLFPRSFLWPQVSGHMPWSIRLPLIGIWAANFTVPLQSALFSVVLSSGHGRWTTNQGVAWTLVALYTCHAMSIVCLFVYWHTHSTGLIWDPRAIADLITLASNSNTMADYKGTELLATRDELRVALQHRAVDKIGYWAWRDGRTNGIWHGIGTDLLDDAWLDAQRAQEPQPQTSKNKNPPRSWNEKLRALANSASVGVDTESLALSPYAAGVRNRYLPWCLRDGPLFCFTFAALVLLTALFIVSFLPSTSLKKGFAPVADAKSSAGTLFATQVLYSFLPALIGHIVFLLASSLDMTLRVLQPWAELSKNAGGGQPSATILADYAACFPLQSTWRAAKNGHFRLALISLLATGSAFLPALSGGVLTSLPISQGVVRVVPNMPLYFVVLALLVLCFAGLVSMLPGRRMFRLPHAVTCIAEILSFCANDDLMQEPAFKDLRKREALLDQLGINSPPTARSRWIFATGTSGSDPRLGIRRVRRYTELTNRPSGRRPPKISGH